MTTLQPRVRIAGVAPKPGEPPEGCQDAVAADAAAGRFAVADGATTSFLAAPWARLLVERFRDAPLDEARRLVTGTRGWPQWLRPAILRWRADADATVSRTAERKQMLLQNRLADGDAAAATFVGVRLASSGGTWEAVGIGDSCLFHVRDGHLARSFPLAASAEFDATPQCLLSSLPAEPAPLRFARGELREGDLLLLATDALAKWLLRQHEAGPAAWRRALDAVTEEDARPGAVALLVERLRGEGTALDDDVGLVVVALEPVSRTAERPAPPRPEHPAATQPEPEPQEPAPETRPREPEPGPRERRRWRARVAPIVRVSARRAPRRSPWPARIVAAWSATALLVALAGVWMGIEARRDLAALEARVRGDTAAGRGAGEPNADTGTRVPAAAASPSSRPDTLPEGTRLWRDGAEGAPEIGRLERDVAVERHPGREGRDSVTFLAWLAATQGNGDTLVRVVDGRAVAARINARATPTLSQNILVPLVSPAPMELVAEDRSSGRLWYHVRVAAAVEPEEEP